MNGVISVLLTCLVLSCASCSNKSQLNEAQKAYVSALDIRIQALKTKLNQYNGYKDDLMKQAKADEKVRDNALFVQRIDYFDDKIDALEKETADVEFKKLEFLANRK